MESNSFLTLIRPVWNGRIQRKMRVDWDCRARENAFHYIASSQTDWDTKEFYRSGQSSVAETVLPDLDHICRGRPAKNLRVLEIGCGAGRMTHALAEVFGEVHGVDISGEMVAQGRRFLADVPNVHLHHNNGIDLVVLGDLRFDFAFSFIVFQHIPSRAIIENYVREVGRVLRPGSLFKFQVQGSSKVAVSESDSWLGAPISKVLAENMAEHNGFTISRSEGAGEQYFWLWFEKPSRYSMWCWAAEDPEWFEQQRLR